jgi:hypothetical protein
MVFIKEDKKEYAVHLVRPVWEKRRETNPLGRKLPPLDYKPQAADDLLLLEHGPPLNDFLIERK